MPDLIEKFFREDLTEAEEQALEESVWASEEEAERLVNLAEKAYYRYGFPKPKWPGSPESPPATGSGFKPWLGLSILVLGTSAALFWRFHQENFFPDLLSSLKTAPVAVHYSPGVKKDRARLSSPSQEGSNKGSHPVVESFESSLEEKTISTSNPNKQEKSSLQGEGSPTGVKTPGVQPENNRQADPRQNPQNLSLVIPFNLDEKPSKKFSSVSVEVHLADPGSVAVRVLDMSGLEVTSLYAGNLTVGHWIFDWNGQLRDGRRTQPGYYQIEVKSGSYIGRKNILIK